MGPVGPNSLEFNYGGEPAGNICELCLENIPGVKVVFKRNEKGKFELIEHLFVEKFTS
jgi:hypothetical protein